MMHKVLVARILAATLLFCASSVLLPAIGSGSQVEGGLLNDRGSSGINALDDPVLPTCHGCYPGQTTPYTKDAYSAACWQADHDRPFQHYSYWCLRHACDNNKHYYTKGDDLVTGGCGGTENIPSPACPSDTCAPTD